MTGAKRTVGLIAMVLVVVALAWVLLGDDGDADRGRSIDLSQPAPAADRAPIDLPEGNAEREARTLAIPDPAPVDPSISEDAPMRVAAPGEFVIRHASGAPASGCRLVAVREGVVIDAVDLDAAGAGTLDVDGPVRVALAGAADRFLALEDPRPRAVTLGPGAEISGTVTVDGLRPRAPLDVALSRFGHGLWGDPRLDLMRRTDPGIAAVPGANAQRVQPGAEFRFSGLHEQWRGRIYVPDHLRFADGSSMHELDGPARDLQLALFTRTSLVGRAITVDGTPVPGAAVTGRVHEDLAGGHRTHQFDETTDELGRFTTWCRWPEENSGQLSIWSETPAAWAKTSFDGVAGARVIDIGDVVLTARKRVPFRAVTTEGVPIPGAVAVATSVSSAPRSDPTDLDGLSVLLGPAGLSSMSVHALPYESADVSLPDGEIVNPLEIVLEGCAELEIRVADAGSLKGLLVRVHSKERLFTRGDSFPPHESRQWLGVPRPRGSGLLTERGEVASGHVDYAVTRDPLLLSCFEPHVPFEVSIVGLAGGTFWKAAQTPMAPGERRLLVIETEPLKPVTVHGIVRDATGQPLSGVRVYMGVDLESGQDPNRGDNTDDDGTFRFDDVHGTELAFEVSAQGYETLFVPRVGVSGRLIELVLQPSEGDG